MTIKKQKAGETNIILFFNCILNLKEGVQKKLKNDQVYDLDKISTNSVYFRTFTDDDGILNINF